MTRTLGNNAFSNLRKTAGGLGAATGGCGIAVGKRWIPLASSSSFHIPNPNRGQFVLQAYFDGSGQNKPGDKMLTLGGIVASGSVWTDFEKEWMATLQAHNLREFHMTDAMALRRSFKGWSNEKVENLLNDLLTVCSKFYSRRFYAKSCTVNLEEYWKFAKEILVLPTPEEICINACCGSGLPEDEENPGAEFQQVELYFDIHEDFRHKIQEPWERGKRKHAGGWINQVQTIATICAEERPPLQAADLIAWTANAYHRKHERAKKLYPIMRSTIIGLHIFYDYGRLVSEYDKRIHC